MKKLLLSVMAIYAVFGIKVFAEPEPVVKIEIPASSIESIDVNYEKSSSPSAASKAIDATKEATDKTIKATKDVTKKTVDKTKTVTDKTVTATKKATKKTVSATKDVTDKTVKATKDVTQKTIQTTKDVTDKTIDGAKDVIDNLNPNKPVTLEELETSASIKTLKNQRNEIKSAYNSRIKDINAQIKAAEASTTITDVQRQNKIYTLNKEKSALIEQRDKEIKNYNNKIAELKAKN